jgi:hypothetical protein
VVVLLLLCGGLFFFVDDFQFLVSTKTDVTIASQGDRLVQMVAVLPKDAIPAIDHPRFVSADRANYAPDELVIGVEVDGETRAYSIPHLSKHEIVNDDIRGVRLAITWCPLCFTAIVYDREIDGTVFDFGVSGKLIMNGLVMYDRQTESYWSQLLGEAIEGPLVGTRLRHYPNTWQTTWAEWLERFPDTIALDKAGSGSGDGYAEYYRNNEAGIHPQTVDDDRLGAKEWIIGVEQDGEAVAYDFGTLANELVVNDVVGDTQTLAVFLPESATGLVYNRTVGEQVLHFGFEDGQLVDLETGSRWDLWTGAATSGALEGQRLRRVPGTRSFWFAWKDWFPGTRVYGQS